MRFPRLWKNSHRGFSFPKDRCANKAAVAYARRKSPLALSGADLFGKLIRITLRTAHSAAAV
jgi:hypothetical protein